MARIGINSRYQQGSRRLLSRTFNQNFLIKFTEKETVKKLIDQAMKGLEESGRIETKPTHFDSIGTDALGQMESAQNDPYFNDIRSALEK